MKKTGFIMLHVIAGAMLLTGCQVHAPAGGGDTITGESYPDAEQYQTGSVAYASDQVEKVEIYWRSGEVVLTESEAEELHVSESDGTLPDAAAVHSYLDHGTLRIRFCASEAQIKVSEVQKHLQVEVPKGIDISVHTTSALVKADALEQNSIAIAAFSGNTELGVVTADDINLSSSSGDIRMDSVYAQTMQCSAWSGSVLINRMQAKEYRCDTSSGNVFIGNMAVDETKIMTSNGDVDLTLSKEGAEVSYMTSSGELYTDAAYTMKGDLYVFAGGGHRVTVESSSGNLHIQNGN